MGGEKDCSARIKRAFLEEGMVSLSARDVKGSPLIGLVPRILLFQSLGIAARTPA